MRSWQYNLARNLLFKLDAEYAHHLSLDLLRFAEKTGVLSPFSGKMPECQPVECMGLNFPNPVGLAAGLDKEGNTIDALGRNPQPRLFRIIDKEAIINRMGFNNCGVEEGVKNVKTTHNYDGIVGFNIGKNKVTPNENAIDDYLAALRGCWGVADYVTVNISSPNTPGLRDLQSANDTAKLLGALKEEQEKLTAESGQVMPIAFKVAPDIGSKQIAQLSKVFKDGGLECLIATNTTIDREQVKGEKHWQEAGGLSGTPVTQKSTEVIAEFHSHLGSDIPIIGVGGIMNGQDAIDKLEAGAKLIQLYTGFIYKGPPLIKEIIDAVNAK